jgi:hypothetical protein
MPSSHRYSRICVTDFPFSPLSAYPLPFSAHADTVGDGRADFVYEEESNRVRVPVANETDFIEEDDHRPIRGSLDEETKPVDQRFSSSS